jgi:hypothetical protein
MKNVLDVARIQAVHRGWLVGWPLVILTLVLALNVALVATINATTPADDTATGALTSIYIVLGISHLQTMTQLFPFALGLSVTRRAFYAGTALVVAAQAAFFGLVLLLLEQVEAATGGWGVGIRMFGLPFVPQGNLLAQWLAYTVPFLAISALGVFMGVVFKRWGQPGVYVTTVGGGVLLAGAAMLITWQGWWTAVGSFFTGQSALALLAGYPLLIALVLGGAGWLVLRRATP